MTLFTWSCDSYTAH